MASAAPMVGAAVVAFLSVTAAWVINTRRFR